MVILNGQMSLNNVWFFCGIYSEIGCNSHQLELAKVPFKYSLNQVKFGLIGPHHLIFINISKDSKPSPATELHSSERPSMAKSKKLFTLLLPT